jgi:serine/threonine protein kinase
MSERCAVCKDIYPAFHMDGTLLCGKNCQQRLWSLSKKMMGHHRAIDVRMRQDKVVFENEFVLLGNAPINVGGYGSLYRAQRRSESHEVIAVKVFDPRFGKASLESEIAALSTLEDIDNPYIIKFFDAFSGTFMGEDAFMLIMEYIAGLDAFDLVSRLTRNNISLSFSTWRDLGEKLFGALAFLHAHDIIHRDIKPENVMFRNVDDMSLRTKLEPVLIDFNLSCVKGSCSEWAMGTPGYIGPEIYEIDKPGVDVHALLKASDGWAMSITMIILILRYIPQWVIDDSTNMNTNETLALTQWSPSYEDVKRKCVAQFSNIDVKKFMKKFFKKGLNVHWRERYTALELQQFFAEAANLT